QPEESIRRSAALIRRGCVWAAGRDELDFDPPWQLTEGALFREGSPWTPQDSQKRAAVVAPTEKTAVASGADSKVGRAVPSAPPPSAVVNDGALRSTRPTKTRPPGTPAIADREPDTQDEKDWIDNRWSRTEVGQFLASSLRLPNGAVTKALSIRVGDRDEAGVCFDTANLNLRAGWTSGFLKFDAARFGLLNIPKINGEVDFIAPDGPGWIGATGRFSGFHVHGKRVVLEYKIGDTTVWESPWFTKTNGVSVFIRTLEIGPGHESLALRLVERTNATVVSYGNSPALVNGLIAVDER